MIIALFCLVITSNAIAQHQTLKRNVYWVLQTCQCRYCMLKNAKLTGFKPGSQLKTVNPFYKDNPFIDKQTKFISDGGWMCCNFTGADFSYANLNYSDFRITLRGYITPLAAANFQNANLNHATLKSAILYGDNFTYATLTSANLQHADLSLANFKNADFAKADLRFAVSTADAMHGWGATLQNADFSYANLTSANLYADFRGANFSHAILRHAMLTTSNEAINDPDWKPNGAYQLWEHTNFSYADLTKATFRDYSTTSRKPDLSKALFCHTIMPDGKINNRDCNIINSKEKIS
jgi:uncharacterized protein YjbI with pentapeptide repeats